MARCCNISATRPATSVLLPTSGLARYRVIEWLGYLGSDVHKSFGPLFNPASSDEVKAARATWSARSSIISRQASAAATISPAITMSVADPYLFAMLGWTGKLGIDLARWPNLDRLPRAHGAARDGPDGARRRRGWLEPARAR